MKYILCAKGKAVLKRSRKNNWMYKTYKNTGAIFGHILKLTKININCFIQNYF